MSEPFKIEPFYQAQAKQIVDCLFDKGLLSETLSRDGMDAIDGLLALYLQLGARSAATCAELTKKYKATSKGRQEGEDQPRHEEETRWIARGKEAEALAASLSIANGELRARILRDDQWSRDACIFLKKVNAAFPFEEEALKLLGDAIKLGIIPEPDCRPEEPWPNVLEPGRTWEVRPGDGCPCPPETMYPGKIIEEICPICGGRKI